VFFLERYAEVWKATRLTHPSLSPSLALPVSHVIGPRMLAELGECALKRSSCGPDLG
jgi:hypothetical protein